MAVATRRAARRGQACRCGWCRTPQRWRPRPPRSAAAARSRLADPISRPRARPRRRAARRSRCPCSAAPALRPRLRRRWASTPTTRRRPGCSGRAARAVRSGWAVVAARPGCRQPWWTRAAPTSARPAARSATRRRATRPRRSRRGRRRSSCNASARRKAPRPHWCAPHVAWETSSQWHGAADRRGHAGGVPAVHVSRPTRQGDLLPGRQAWRRRAELPTAKATTLRRSGTPRTRSRIVRN
eukprot:scaffold95840_cov61-Phaeocystis_antarctica.AAC.2